MTFGIGTYGLGVLAGILTTLSPCVLPLLPILMSSALSSHRWGPLALAAGVATSFTLLGVLLAAFGASLGLQGDTFRMLGALLFVSVGVLLVSSRLQAQFAQLTGRLSQVGGELLARFALDSLSGQYILGLLLGMVWSPCVGPTLGAAVTLASRGQDLAQIALLMAVFAVGASVPMLLIGMSSRAAFARSREALRKLSTRGKQGLGFALIALGILTLSHADRSLEAWLLDHSPAWLTGVTTRF